jgi:large subunit ribosomal protein L23
MNAERLMMVLREPHTSEKSTVIGKFNQFAFKVLKDATKNEVKAAIEHMFNVKVKNIAIVNVKGKAKRFKQTVGRRSDWKKAYVTLQAGQDIDFAVTE